MMIQERDYFILLWLLYHPFSKLEQMKHLFECRNPHRAPYRRLLKLVKEGFVETVWIATEPQRYRKIFQRYAEKEKYDAVLYILPTEARIDKLQERVSYIPRKIFFISEEKLFRKKENATFFSSSDGLPLKQLIYWSRGNGSVEDLDHLEPEELKEAIHNAQESSLDS